MFTGTPKDIITTVCSLLYAIVVAVQQVVSTMDGGSLNWMLILSAVVMAVIGWFTGKTGDGKAKTA
jgi:hypothetical protein